LIRSCLTQAQAQSTIEKLCGGNAGNLGQSSKAEAVGSFHFEQRVMVFVLHTAERGNLPPPSVCSQFLTLGAMLNTQIGQIPSNLLIFFVSFFDTAFLIPYATSPWNLLKRIATFEPVRFVGSFSKYARNGLILLVCPHSSNG
jgi:hypothetical protein